MRRQDYNKRTSNNDNRSSRNMANQRGLLDMPPALMNNHNSLLGVQGGFLGNQGGMMGQGSLMGGPGGLFDGQGSLFGNQTGMHGSRSGGMIGADSMAQMAATQAELLRNQLSLLESQGILGMAGQDLLKNQNLLGMLASRSVNSLMGSQMNDFGPGLNSLQGSVSLGRNQPDAITSLLGDVPRENSRMRPGNWTRPSSGQAGILGPPPDTRRVMPLLSGDDTTLGMGPPTGKKLIPSLSFQNSKHGSDSNRSSIPFANTCEVCNWSYNTSAMEHYNTLDHKKKARLVKKGCLLCKTGKFKNYPEYVKHLDSAKHKQNKEQLNKDIEAKKKNAEMAKSSVKQEKSPDKESAELLPLYIKVENESESKAVSQEDAVQDTEEMIMDNVAEGECESSPKADSLVYDPNVAVGQEHVISVTGYFCKLCRKFYNNEVAAKVTHCKSEAHFLKYQESIKLK